MKIVFILCLTLSYCNIFSDSIKYPNVAIYENKSEIMIKFKPDSFSKFKKILQKNKIELNQKSHEYKNSILILLNLKQFSILEKSEIEYNKVTDAAFKFYDETYLDRLENKYENLDSIVQGYKDEILNEIYLTGLAEEFKDKIELHILGKSRLGRNLYAIKIKSTSNNEVKASVLFVGAHHANELISTEHAYDILYQILKYPSKYNSILENLEIWIVPLLNPDGSHFFWHKSISMGRKNGFLANEMKSSNIFRGVDLNRNYPFKWNSGQTKASSGRIDSVFYRGSSPASEPETRAMVSLAKKEQFLFALSFHSNAAAILFPYTIEDTINPEPDYAKDLGKQLVQRIKSYRTDRNFSLRKNLYPVDGTDQDYYYHEFGTNAYIVESSHQNPDYPVAMKVQKGFRKSWQHLLEEFRKGNKLILKILNEKKEPVIARVNFPDIIYFEKEVFYSNEEGKFIKMFSETSKINIEVSHPDYKIFKKEFQVSDKLEFQTIVLEKNE
jgi:murein tripeptide amidase MpaA